MNRQYFGTDGVRGEYGGTLLTDEFAFHLARAAGHWLGKSDNNPFIVIGRDTRQSGPALRDALAKGFQSVRNMRILDLGVLPTPAVPVYVRNVRASLGVVITASHNPAQDNGIKFFNSNGLKLADAEEVEIESFMDDTGELDTDEVVDLEPAMDSASGYLDLLQPVLKESSLSALKLVVDTANGATCKTTPALLKHFGAKIELVGDQPDGTNINLGVGSQFPKQLAQKVLQAGADMGIAHDGDGDRVLFCDEKGKVVHGDVLLCMLAFHEMKQGRLNDNTLVATKQSNLGLEHAMKAAGGKLRRTDVGDRYVLEEMLRSGYNLGGENSGHIIFSDINPSGDGLLSALKLLSILVEEQKPLSELQACMRLLPQKTGALPIQDKLPLEGIPEIQETLDSLKTEMGEEGRVLLRYSGTEPKIRLLIEGDSIEKVDRWYQMLEYSVKEQLS